MAKYKVYLDGEEQDGVFDSYAEADDYGGYLCGCARVGAETLHMSNPGDYDFDPDDWDGPDYEVVKID